MQVSTPAWIDYRSFHVQFWAHSVVNAIQKQNKMFLFLLIKIQVYKLFTDQRWYLQSLMRDFDLQMGVSHEADLLSNIQKIPLLFNLSLDCITLY